MIDDQTVEVQAVRFSEWIVGGDELACALQRSMAHHAHLCPRQVLGARIGFAGLAALGIPVRPEKKELLVLAETDGCFLSGLEAATNVTVNHRTLRIVDYGKIAATIVHVASGTAFRLHPRPDIRERACLYADPGETRRYFAMLAGYQRMPVEELLSITPVTLLRPAARWISRPGVRTVCAGCGEEILNEREIFLDGQAFCKPCAGAAGYYLVTPSGE